MAVTTSSNDVLITYSLGSCLGISLYDPAAGVGGLVHCMLPLSRIDRNKARQKPGMFVDTGIVMLLQKVLKHGAQRANLIVKVAGGASVLDCKDLFKIGERNHTVLRQLLWKYNIPATAEEVGGTVARTMSLHMATGETWLKIRGQEYIL